MIYITGASGRVGRRVLKLLPEAIPLVRKKTGLKKEIITNFSEEELKKIFKNAKVIIHLAGSMNFLNHYELWEANVKLTERIVNAAPKDARIIFASSISVYGKEMKEIPANENTPLDPDTPYAKSKSFAEDFVKKHPNYVILRLGTIYGPEFEDYSLILRMIKEGKMQILGEGRNRVSFIHVDDAAKVIVNAVKKGKGIYVVSGESETQENILTIAAGLLKVPVPTKKVPVFMALLFAQAEEMKASMSKSKPTITQEHVRILSSDRAFDCSKAKKELGFKSMKIKEGIEEIVKNMKN